jgi:hypothetical protein
MNPAGGECRIGSVGYRTPFTEVVTARVADGRIAALCPPGDRQGVGARTAGVRRLCQSGA